MRLALLSPLPPEQNGLADYASHLLPLATLATSYDATTDILTIG